MIRILTLLALAQTVLAQGIFPLRLHENPRVMGMGGAFVAVADDPQGGLLNPAGLKRVTQIGTDLSYSAGTAGTPDQIGSALVNPGTASGASFCTGFLAQGLTDQQKVKYYVPYTGTAWSPLGGSNLGLTVRFPYRTSDIDSIKARWEAIGDLSVMQGFQQMAFGAQIERMFGGAADMVPRRLRMGASLGRQNQYTIAYEWRGSETLDKFDFHYDSSHLGGELVSKKYVAMRAGYIWGQEHRVTFGTAIGLMERGWRVEASWDVPTGDRAETRWSAGIAFRG